MANRTQMRILEQGTETWNDWREGHLHEEVDLSESDLHEFNLSGAYLWRANLSKSNLSRTNLFRADLTDSNLYQAIISEAYLREADLSMAEFSEADMHEANFSRSRLHYANLRGANLSGANLTEADFSFTNLTGAELNGADVKNSIFAYTIFGDTGLANVKNIETCHHKSPSIIDQMTLRKSIPLPKIFLQGCGLLDNFIEHIPTLFGSASDVEFYSCFISYGHEDKLFARRLHDTLQRRGIRCWLDEKQLHAGEDIYQALGRGIGLFDKVLLCCSKNSLGRSWWVDYEIEAAFEKERKLFEKFHKKVFVLIPLSLDGYVFTDQWQSGKRPEVLSRYIPDFIGWKRDNRKFASEVRKLAEALRLDRGV